MTPYDLPDDYNPHQIDPALLTFAEWYKIVNPSDKSHPLNSYDLDVRRLNDSGYTEKSNFPKLLRRIQRHGLTFEVRLQLQKTQWMKRDPDGLPIRINDQIVYYTDQEASDLRLPLHEWMIGIFDGDTCVGTVQDEWGCVLVMVAREYRGFGIGLLLHKMARQIAPNKPSGGFTPYGLSSFRKMYREFVGDALRSGTYTALIRQGKLTVERVREIIQSAGPRNTQTPELNLRTDDPDDWLLYVSEHGDFVVYDKKLREMLDEGERFDHFIERMIRGMAYVQIHEGRDGDWAMLRAFGGETPGIRRFLIACAIEYCQRENCMLYLEQDDPRDVDPSMAHLEPPSLVRGFRSQKVVPTGKRFNYDGFAAQELRWRKQFDRYDEFRIRMLEMAYAKYQQPRLNHVAGTDEYSTEPLA